MAGSSPPGEPRPPVRVRYYPRRVARPPTVAPLSPGQALHLVDDPQRAALARHTAEQQVFVAGEQPAVAPATQAPAPEPAPVVTPTATPAAGWWRRTWRRLTASG